VANGIYSVTNTFKIIVEESNLPPVLPVIPNQLVIVPGGSLAVTNTATDPDLPANPLTYTLTSSVPGANIPAIDPSTDVITWTPMVAQAGSNYLFTTVVMDTNPWAVNAKSLSATNSFYVTVLPIWNNGSTNTFDNGIIWFVIPVPTNAIAATNTLIFSTLPINVWFTTNLPPATTNATELLANRTNGVSILTTNLATAPTNIVPGGYYLLGFESTNAGPVFGAFEVDFAFAAPAPVLPTIPIQVITAGDTLVVTNTASDANTNAALIYYLTNSPAGVVIGTNGIITWVTTTNLGPTNVIITTVVTDTNANLSAANSFLVIVLPGLVDDQPQTNIVAPNSINWFTIKVPTNAVQATNFLLFATAPVNLWFSTNVPPAITNAADFELLTNSLGGSYVIGTNTVPRLVPGSRYFLGVQNTNSFIVTNAVKVKFHLVFASGSFSFFSIVPTNIAGSNGFRLTWFAPTNDQFHLQWTPALTPANWQNFNGVISLLAPHSPTNGLFQYFDDGSQTGGFGPTRFYRLLLLNSPTNTAPFFLNHPVLFYALPSVPFVYINAAKDWDVPPQTLAYSVTNTLIGTNLVTITANGVIAWTPAVAQLGQTNWVTTTVLDSGVPAKMATSTFAILVTTNIPAAPPFSSIVASASGVTFRWTAPTNEQFQIRWTTNLVPISWHLFPDVITSPTTNFSFVDTNTPLLWLKFYQLILLP